jgi:hypothetical protein
MSELLTPFGDPPEATEDPANPAEVAAPSAPAAADEATSTSVLITEQEVLFATAAAVAPTKSRRRWSDPVRVIGAALRAMFVRSADDDTPPKPRHYPSRNDFLEPSRMAREMYRL